ncbi:MAG: glutamate 5-kinase [Phycisphaerae bacterium]
MPNDPAVDSVRQHQIAGVHRIVVKVGSGVISNKGRLRRRFITEIAGDIIALRQRGYEVVVVASGAVAAGYAALDMPRPPTAVVERQAAASIGQYKLMSTFVRAFGKHKTQVAQLLMTEEDIENRRRFLSARHTLQVLISRGIIPVINENDPLADDEEKIGDNDHLAALVSSVASAHLLILLSTVPGVLRNGRQGSVIHQVDVGSTVDEHIDSSVSESGVGGMVAKVSAARLASGWGVPTIIADGRQPGMLGRILDGERIGTIFLPASSKLSARKRWIAVRTKSRGAVRVDAGAQRAVQRRGASLLPAGVVDVQGRFSMGARVDVQDESGTTFAVGLTSYSADEIRRMMGKQQREFKEVLGYEYVGEIIGRDDMVLLGKREAHEVD